MSAPLNLASRPVRNDRLPALLFFVATALLAGATLYHGLLVRRLWPSRSSALHAEVVGLRSEMQNLRAQAVRMRTERVPAQQLAEWKVIRDLVDQRTFWWSELFQTFEEVLPPEVRLLTVTPRVSSGNYRIDITARLDSAPTGLSLVHTLEERPEFEGVNPHDCAEKNGEVECRYTMRYLGRGTEPRAGIAPSAALAVLEPKAPVTVARGGER
jgi:hypothetical protein